MNGEETCLKNLHKINATNIHYHSGDCEDMLLHSNYKKFFGDKKIDFYLFDAGHDFKSQYMGLKIALPHLSDEAIIAVDDASDDLPDVDPYNATVKFLKDNPFSTRLIRTMGRKDGISIGVMFLYYNKFGKFNDVGLT